MTPNIRGSSPTPYLPEEIPDSSRIHVLLHSPASRALQFDHGMYINLGLGQLSQTTDGRSDSGSGGSGNGVSTASNSLLARLTVPDAGGVSLHGSLTAERAVVLGVLLHLHLFGLSSQRRTVSDTELTGDTNLLSSLSPVC